MYYYHVFYNCYPPGMAPEKKEEWIASQKDYDDTEAKEQLENREGIPVTIISREDISEEFYQQRKRP